MRAWAPDRPELSASGVHLQMWVAFQAGHRKKDLSRSLGQALFCPTVRAVPPATLQNLHNVIGGRSRTHGFPQIDAGQGVKAM
ncbi:Uncharacterised protein [Mycobacterium tuberculosis]|nr:hypothetical protein X414_03456 [Mycobacterium tuberculosis XTB13-209]KCR56556.1 hypothetical protein X216_02625 [Mycobacterium tuberculosis BTB12-400]CKN73600.1 Uncharacterised protein [Mycobacterium tuberculosis]CKT28320.1 Uncharacterised protein [Mycobacterium tuberculosis]CMM29535.1 Uncharacterised protein [Mycobacterium tuberculosis]